MVKSTEAEGRIIIDRERGRGNNRESLFKRYKVSVTQEMSNF